MILEIENKSSLINPTSSNIRTVIHKLRSHGPSSYASLTDDRGNYMQVAGGGITCILEWRDVENRRHYRAHLEFPSKAFPDGTILSFGGGEVKLRADEWLTATIIEEAFVAFLKGNVLPQAIRWRDISNMFWPDN